MSNRIWRVVDVGAMKLDLGAVIRFTNGSLNMIIGIDAPNRRLTFVNTANAKRTISIEALSKLTNTCVAICELHLFKVENVEFEAVQGVEKAPEFMHYTYMIVLPLASTAPFSTQPAWISDAYAEKDDMEESAFRTHAPGVLMELARRQGLGIPMRENI